MSAELFDVTTDMTNRAFLHACFHTWEHLGIRFSTQRKLYPNRGLKEATIKQYERTIERLPSTFLEANVYSLDEDTQPVDDVVKFVEELPRSFCGPHDRLSLSRLYLTLVANGLQHLVDLGLLHKVPPKFHRCYDRVITRARALAQTSCEEQHICESAESAPPVAEMARALLPAEPTCTGLFSTVADILLDSQRDQDEIRSLLRYRTQLDHARQVKENNETTGYSKAFIELADVSKRIFDKLLEENRALKEQLLAV